MEAGIFSRISRARTFWTWARNSKPQNAFLFVRKSEVFMLVSFRSCGPKDHAALLKLVLAYNRFEKNYANRKSLSQGLDVLLRNPSQGKLWLLEYHKKPVGYALLTYNFELEFGGAEGVLRDLFVEREYRNRGIGSLALYEIEDYCRERGMRAFQLQVPRRNKSA